MSKTSIFLLPFYFYLFGVQVELQEFWGEVEREDPREMKRGKAVEREELQETEHRNKG